MDEDADLQLLARWRSGDAAAGGELFQRHFDEIYEFLAHKVGDDAADLAQRTFTACIAARERFRGQSSFRTYLFAIARNTLYNFLTRRPHGEQIDFEQTSIAELVTSVAGRLDRARGVERLRATLRQLPAEQQLLLELHYWHDLDATALAEVFDVPPGTIRVRLLRARRALRDRMEQDGPLPPAPTGDRLADAGSRPELEDE